MIRSATLDDATAIRSIYAPWVTDSVVSFEEDVPSVEEMAARIERSHLWLVCEDDAGVVGYAYGSPHRARAAYRFTVEVSAYVRADLHGRGIGRRLYGELLPQLAERGFHMAVAGITVPNDQSVGFHRSLGFRDIGRFPQVGWKLDRWHDTFWMSKALGVS